PLQLLGQDLPSYHELMYVREKLIEMQQEDLVIPQKEEEVAFHFRMKPVKWRYVYFQLQSRGMIDKNTVFKNATLDKNVFQDLDESVQQLLQDKRDKLMEMIDYVQHNGCFRHKLYSRFNQEILKVRESCCSNCQ